MSSVAKANWDNFALASLNEIEKQCRLCDSASNPNPILLDENLRAFVMLLSGHFQEFCRDLYSECVQAVAMAIPAQLSWVIQLQCNVKLDIEKSNPRIEILKSDFDRYGTDLGLKLSRDPANAQRITHLDILNKWRNYSAHRAARKPVIGALDLPHIRIWQKTCDELVTELDRIMYNQMKVLIGTNPW